jgi:hypothetical protein
MNIRLENKLSSYLAVVAVCDAEPAAWQVYKAFGDAYAEFKTVVDTIMALSPKGGRKATGLTQDKRRVRVELATVAHEVAAAARAYAEKTQNGELAAKVSLSRTQILAGRDLATADRSQNILAATQPVVGQLADFGTTPADLTVLEGLLETYRELLPKPREAVISVTAVNRKLREEFRRADHLLHRQMSALEPKLRRTAPDGAARFASAKAIVDATASRTASPAPAPAPVPAA